MGKLHNYRANLIDFESRIFPDQILSESEAKVDTGIISGWEAVVIATLGNIAVGVSTLYRGPIIVSNFSVGIAYVDENYRGNGIWYEMSTLVENEAKESGAQLLIRNISVDALFLQASLLQKGYLFDYDAGNWPTQMYKKL